MRAVLLTILVLLVGPTIAVPAAGNHPPPTCQWTTSSATLMIGSGQWGSWTYYIVVDYLEEGQVGGLVWLYEETNTKNFLQRGDFVKDDTCNGWIDWDRIII